MINVTRLLNVWIFIMSETPTANKQFVTESSDLDEYMPAEVYILGPKIRTDVDSLHRRQVSALDTPNVGSFCREVHAYLYTSVQEAMHITDPCAAIARMSLLDSKLQGIFGKLTCQSGVIRGSYCASIAFTIRYAHALLLQKLMLTILSALFDLHSVVSYRTNLHELHETSRVALRTTVRMVVDVARSLNQRAPGIDVEFLTPRCSHLVRAGPVSAQ